MPEPLSPEGYAATDETPCVACGDAACAGACTDARLAALAQAFPGVQAQAQALYAAYVAGLGPLGTALPPWDALIDRQQYAWRCVARATHAEEAP